MQGNRQACHNKYTEQEKQQCDSGPSPANNGQPRVGLLCQKSYSYELSDKSQDKERQYKKSPTLSQLIPHKDPSEQQDTLPGNNGGTID